MITTIQDIFREIQPRHHSLSSSSPPPLFLTLTHWSSWRCQHHEGSLRFGERYLVFPKYPAECDYVRIVDCHSLAEIAYWTVTEWEEAGAEVMGAIIGAMCEGVQKG